MLLHFDAQQSRRARRRARERAQRAVRGSGILALMMASHISGVTSGGKPQRTPESATERLSVQPPSVAPKVPTQVLPKAPIGAVPLASSTVDEFVETPVRVTVVGDIHMQGAARGLLDPANESSRLALASLVQGSDVTIGNLESALGVGGTPEHKDFTFLAPLETLDVLGAVGFDVVTMANNHGLDYGRDLIPQAVAANGRSGVGIVGIGRNAAEAYAPYVADVRGVRVAVIGLSDVFDDAGAWSATDTNGGLASVRDMARVDAAVRSASSIADYTIVYLHWGTEREVCPSDRQRALVNQLAADGADAIVGAHAHRVQGSGFVGSTFVSYGLGNFIWYQDGGDSGRSEAVSFELSDSVVKGFSVTPVTIHLGIPSADAPEKVPEAQQVFEKRATCAGVSPTPIQSATP